MHFHSVDLNYEHQLAKSYFFRKRQQIASYFHSDKFSHSEQTPWWKWKEQLTLIRINNQAQDEQNQASTSQSIRGQEKDKHKDLDKRSYLTKILCTSSISTGAGVGHSRPGALSKVHGGALLPQCPCSGVCLRCYQDGFLPQPTSMDRG